ncbi:MAG: hypothetical protein FWH27_16685, partial [Planctomycetaceae bacterium]|nr:hypothetical protein [Planctomycetaceae bacterium]
MSDRKSLLNNILSILGFKSESNRKSLGKLHRRHLHMEPLEERQLLSVTVGVSVLDGTAKEGTSVDYGQYRISRSSPDSTSLTVSFKMEGTATYSSSSGSSDYLLYNASGSQIYLYQEYDYTTYQYVYTGSVTIPANQT